MKKINTIVGTLFSAGLLVSSMPALSHAYLDAGSGSMMMQLLLAGTAGMAVLGRLLWQQITHNVKSFVSKILIK